MKKLAAIFFLLVVVFNIYGYRVVLSFLQQNADVAIAANIDRQQYTDSELISIKTSLHLPYYSSSPAFERAYGSINIEGTDYEYVKRRVYNDTLELLCLPNHNKTQLQAVSNEIAKSAADGTTSLPLKKTILKIALPDFFQNFAVDLDNQPASDKITHTLFSIIRLSFDYFSRQERPPQFNA